MSGEPYVTIAGSAGGDAQLKFLPSGVAVSEWSMAVTPRVKQNDQWVDGETVWYRCKAWRQLGESTAESIVKGMRLLVYGRLQVRTFTDREGAVRTSLEVDVEHVGAEMRYASVKAIKAERSSAHGSSGTGGGAPATDDPWGAAPAASGPAAVDDEPPF